MHEQPTQQPAGADFGPDARLRSRDTVPYAVESAIRELDHRYSDGIDVRLLWHPGANRVLVAVKNERDAESFAFEVDPARALDGFRHPYAYVSRAPNGTSRLRVGAPFKPGHDPSRKR
jgi:hypothetical protein